MRARGFTLIELLIVVAIIAILAAIAVPNFLEAQVRAKVSRVKSDIRSFATAIEAYQVDHNAPPREYGTGTYGDPLVRGETVSGIIYPGSATTFGISTPIAYISQAWILDPFVTIDVNIAWDQTIFTYQDLHTRGNPSPPPNPPGPRFSQAFAVPALDFYGNWRMCSIGPDRDFFNNLQNPGSSPFGNAAQLIYDPTNGTISTGNIWRSQKRSDSEQPPVGPLLGAH